MSDWRITSFGRIRKVPPLEASQWRNTRRPAQGSKRRDYGEAEIDRMCELLEAGYGYAEIGRILGRSAWSIEYKLKRMRYRRIHTTLSAQAVGRLLGKACHKSIATWIRRGILPAHNASPIPTRAAHRIRMEDLLVFLEDRRYWMAWDANAITDLALREWAQELRQVGRWLTPPEVAERCHVAMQTVNTWIRRGQLPARRYGNWWVWDGDLVGFVPPCDNPKPRRTRRKTESR